MKAEKAFTRGFSVVLLYLCAICPFALSPRLSLAAPAAITRATGVVQVRYGSFIDRGTGDTRQRAPAPAGAVPWATLSILPAPLAAGDEVRTGAGASIAVELQDGSLLDLGADASMAVEDLSKGRYALRLGLGTLRAQVRKDPSRRFEVRTPTTLCSVRGTDFAVTVGAGGRTQVDLRSGLLGVEDNRGRQTLLRPGESLRVDLRGMANPERSPEPEQARRGDFRSRMRRELALDSSREEPFAAAARETRLAEHQQGRALMDLSGRRARVEEYFLRPRSDQVRLVALNSREGRLAAYSFL
ncbi:MAG: FecR family protein, partial [Elusimicrobiota bacterium]